jgi:hypothetical protein
VAMTSIQFEWTLLWVAVALAATEDLSLCVTVAQADNLAVSQCDTFSMAAASVAAVVQRSTVDLAEASAVSHNIATALQEANICSHFTATSSVHAFEIAAACAAARTAVACSAWLGCDLGGGGGGGGGGTCTKIPSGSSDMVRPGCELGGLGRTAAVRTR